MLRMKDLVCPLFRSPVARAGPPGGGRTRLGVAQLEDRTVPSVSVSVVTLPGSPNEWGDTGKFRFTRSGGPISSALMVNTTVEGTAGAGDYSGPGGSVVFPANVSQVDVTVTVTDDSIPEPDETVQVRILSGSGYNVGSPDRAQVSIGDNDAQLTFTLSAYAGAIGYTVPYDDVDSSQSSQSVSLSNLQVNLAGQLLSASTATAQFASGVLTGVTFSIDTSGIGGYPFNSISMSGMTVTGVVRATLQQITATAVGPPWASVWFHQNNNDTQATALDGVTRVRVKFVTAGGEEFEYDGVTVGGQTVGETADLVRNAMPDGWVIKSIGSGRGFTVLGYKAAGQPFDPISHVAVHYTTTNVNKPQARIGPRTSGVSYIYWNSTTSEWQATPP